MPEREDRNPRSPGFDRRAFLRGSGVAVAATAIATGATEEDAQAQTAGANVVSGATDVKLTINGREQTVNVTPNVTLLDLLRNDLNLTGAKDVEDTSVAGADTVIVDGKAVMAGTRFVVECAGQKIETVESLGNGDGVDEVISGFVKHDALQCGFCTPGFVMATRAFLNKNPNASLEEIQAGLGGNLCRCGTYHGISQCALEIARKGGA